MSQTFYLVCHKTRKRVWVGQGWGKMTSFYSANTKAMNALSSFLNDQIKNPLHFVCADTTEEIHEYEEYFY